MSTLPPPCRLSTAAHPTVHKDLVDQAHDMTSAACKSSESCICRRIAAMGPPRCCTLTAGCGALREPASLQLSLWSWLACAGLTF
jgi:hypothetical protein